MSTVGYKQKTFREAKQPFNKRQQSRNEQDKCRPPAAGICFENLQLVVRVHSFHHVHEAQHDVVDVALLLQHVRTVLEFRVRVNCGPTLQLHLLCSWHALCEKLLCNEKNSPQPVVHNKSREVRLFIHMSLPSLSSLFKTAALFVLLTGPSTTSTFSIGCKDILHRVETFQPELHCTIKLRNHNSNTSCTYI